MKKLIILAVIAVVISAVVAVKEEPKSLLPAKVAKPFNSKQAYHYISKLVSFGNRYPTNKIEHVKALNYLVRALKGFGYKPQKQNFPTGIVTGTNIIAVVPQKESNLKKKLIVIGAHYDSEDSVGANDNGSGTGILLELARDLTGLRLPYRLEIVFFDSEEMKTATGVAHPGSKFYFRNLSAKKRKTLTAMINLDGPGYGRSPLYVGDDRKGDNWIIDHIYKTAKKIKRPVVKAGRSQFQGFSDYEIFTASGVSTAAVSADGAPQHSPLDNMSNVSLVRIDSAGKIILKSLLTIK